LAQKIPFGDIVFSDSTHRDYMNEMKVAYSKARARGISEVVLSKERELQSRLKSAQENASVRLAASHGEFLAAKRYD
jgi:hypothetical protein